MEGEAESDHYSPDSDENWPDPLGAGDRAALIYVLVAVLVLSLIPVAIESSGPSINRVSVGAGMLIGSLALSTLARLTHPINKRRELSLISVIKRCCSDDVGLRTIAIPFALMSISWFSWVGFAWSTVYIDTAVTVSLYETWPILWILSIQIVDRRRRGPWVAVVSRKNYALMALVVPAVLMVAYSSSSEYGEYSIFGQISFVGIIIALLASVSSALMASSLLFTDRVLYGRTSSRADVWQGELLNRYHRFELEESVGMAGRTIAGIAAIPASIVISTVGPGLLIFRSVDFLLGVLIGSGVGLAELLFRRAHLIGARREIVSIQYLSPLFALLWLYLFSEVYVVHPDWLIFGTLSIVTVNMLITSDPEGTEESSSIRRDPGQTTQPATQERYGLRILILSLLFLGIIVYSRPELPLSGANLDGIAYWTPLAVMSTVFALLYSFRLSRVESLKSEEDDRTFALIRRVEMLPQFVFHRDSEKTTRASLISCIRRLNREFDMSKVQSVYSTSQHILQRTTDRIVHGELKVDYDVQREISEIRAELDALAHGRQKARDDAEQIALSLIGGTIVVLAILTPSVSSGIFLLVSHFVAIVLGSVVCFLLWHLVDIGRSRRNDVICETESDSVLRRHELRVLLHGDENLTWRRIFAGLLIFSIVATQFWLLWWTYL